MAKITLSNSTNNLIDKGSKKISTMILMTLNPRIKNPLKTQENYKKPVLKSNTGLDWL